MKHIVKQNTPASFEKWKTSPPPKVKFKQLRGELKNTLKQTLLAEQGHICCYCERRITEEDSHIEHFRPQSDPSVDPLDYGNFLCSCQKQGQKGIPRHCGHLKDEWFDHNLLVSPFDPDCEYRFAFTGNGGIEPRIKGDSAATTTIKKLGLNIPKLKAERAKAIEPFLDDSLSQQEVQNFVSAYLRKDASGRFEEFWATIRYLFGYLSSRIE